jgi:hypothetical protein
MITSVSPCAEHYEDTLSALRLSDRVTGAAD